MNIHQLLPREKNWMWDLGTDPHLLDIVQKHLGPNFVLNSTQLLVKPPVSVDADGGRYMPYHQDGQILRTIWLPLDDVDGENGSLILRPRWHRKGRLPVCDVQNKAKCLLGRPQFAESQVRFYFVTRMLY